MHDCECMCVCVWQGEERALIEKMKTFKKRSQAQWGVPLDLVSPLCWQSAVFELAGVELNLTPSTQLHILTRTIKAIYSEFKLVVLPRLQAKGNYEVYISADDLVPIFMFVFCQSDLRHPIKNRELMWSLCHPDQLQVAPDSSRSSLHGLRDATTLAGRGGLLPHGVRVLHRVHPPRAADQRRLHHAAQDRHALSLALARTQ